MFTVQWPKRVSPSLSIDGVGGPAGSTATPPWCPGARLAPLASPPLRRARVPASTCGGASEPLTATGGAVRGSAGTSSAKRGAPSAIPAAAWGGCWLVAWGGGGSVASAGAPRPPLAYAHLPAAAVPPRRSNRGHNSGHVDVEAADETTEADQVLKMFQVWGLLCRLLGRYAA